MASQLTMVPAAAELFRRDTLSASAVGEADTIATSCDYPFEIGGRYLIYAHRTKDGRFTTTRCAGTKPVEKATEDLEYIQSASKDGTTGHVYGKIEREAFDPSDRSHVTDPARDVAIVVEGFYRRFRTESDANGLFDITVPAGRYSVRPVVPGTVHVYQLPENLFVPAGGCAAPVSFTLRANGRVEGLILREGGRGAANVSVALFAAELATSNDVPDDLRRFAHFSMTDASGHFRLNGVYPGRYRLGVNVSMGPSPESPFAALFYPGVSEFGRAQIIDVPLAPRRARVTMALRSLRIMSGSATVFAASGSPATGAFVMVSFPEYPGGAVSSGVTDGKGRFQFKTIRGHPYVVRVMNPIGRAEPETKKAVAADTRHVDLAIGP